MDYTGPNYVKYNATISYITNLRVNLNCDRSLGNNFEQRKRGNEITRYNIINNKKYIINYYKTYK